MYKRKKTFLEVEKGHHIRLTMRLSHLSDYTTASKKRRISCKN